MFLKTLSFASVGSSPISASITPDSFRVPDRINRLFLFCSKGPRGPFSRRFLSRRGHRAYLKFKTIHLRGTFSCFGGRHRTDRRQTSRWANIRNGAHFRIYTLRRVVRERMPSPVDDEPEPLSRTTVCYYCIFLSLLGRIRTIRCPCMCFLFDSFSLFPRNVRLLIFVRVSSAKTVYTYNTLYHKTATGRHQSNRNDRGP